MLKELALFLVFSQLGPSPIKAKFIPLFFLNLTLGIMKRWLGGKEM